jgi:hypothetical protein
MLIQLFAAHMQVLTNNQSSKAADVYAFGVMCWVGAEGRPDVLIRQGPQLEGPARAHACSRAMGSSSVQRSMSTPTSV